MKIVILGSGNVATHIGNAFHSRGHTIAQVYSRNKANAHALASVLNADTVDALEDLNADADLYFIAVSDSAIAAIADGLPPITRAIVAHCSGATDMSVLSRFPLRGVIYPAQSLHKDTISVLADIPFGIEGSDATTENQLFRLMQEISPKSFLCNSEQRLALHTAAVFANNFSNALFQIAYTILKEHKLSFDLLRPLILETAQKVQQQVPKTVQTGPAQRDDMETIQRHLQFLRKNPDWLKIYQQLTKEITRNKED